MPKRQAHSKSRRGCRQCKTGHIKCDEVRPACKHCVRRAQDCDYSAFRHLRSLHPQITLIKPRNGSEGTESSASYCRAKSEQNLCREAAIYHAFESNTIRPRGPRVRPAVHLLEIRLLHTYMSSASALESIYSDGHHVKSSIQNIFKLATECHYLMDILMSASATWLRAQNPHDQVLVEASHNYALRAIRECSRQIRQGVNESNAEGLFIASIIVAMQAFANRQYDILREDNYSKTGELPLLQWLRQFQGVRAIKEAGWTWIQKSEPIGPMLSALPAMIMKDGPNRVPFFNYLLEGLDENDISSETRAAYGMTVAYLSFVINDPVRRGLLGFPISISERFLELLQERDPRAMTIVGSYFALMGLSRRSDYLMGAAEREFDFIMKQLPVEWLPRMSWAEDVLIRCKSAKRLW